MRNVRLPLAVLVLGLAACQADSFPTTPNAAIPGVYKLTTINGSALPFSFRPDSTIAAGTTDTTVYRETRYQDDYELMSSGRFRFTIVDSAITHITNGSTDVITDYSVIEVGNWQQTSNSVLLTADSATFPGQSQVKLTTPDSWEVPLPSGDAISGTATVAHGSLGPGGTVYVSYTFVWPKQ
jgi:hypothetical protein